MARRRTIYGALTGVVVLIAVLVAGIGGAAATGTVRYVAPGGSDTNPDSSPNQCTDSGSPCATIAQAISVASSGDTISITGGGSPYPAVSVTMPLTFQGTGHPSVASFDVPSGTGAVTIETLTASGGVTDEQATSGDGLTLSSDTLSGTTGVSDTGSGALTLSSDTVNATATGVSDTGSGTLTLTGDTISGFGTAGVSTGSSAKLATSGANTIGPGASGTGIQIAGTGGVSGASISGVATGIADTSSSNLTFSGNSISAATDGITSTGAVTLTGNGISGYSGHGVNAGGNVTSSNDRLTGAEGSSVGLQTSGGGTASGDTIQDNGTGVSQTGTAGVTVDNTNTIQDNGIGVSAIAATITGNEIIDNTTGIKGSGTLTATNNRIVGNSVAGLTIASGASASATDNWWGCNAGPGNSGCDSAQGTFKPYLQLGVTPSSTTIQPNSGVLLTGALSPSGGTDSNIGAFPSSSLTFGDTNSSLGTVQPSYIWSNGAENAAYDANSSTGTDTVNVGLDNQTVSATVQVGSSSGGGGGGGGGGGAGGGGGSTPPPSNPGSGTPFPTTITSVNNGAPTEIIYVPVYTGPGSSSSNDSGKSQTPTPTPGPRATVAAANGKAVTSSPLKVSSSGLVSLTVSNPTGAAQNVEVFFTTTIKGKLAILVDKGVRFGGIKKLTLHVRLSKQGLALLKQDHGQMPVLYTLVVNGKTTVKHIKLKG